MKVEEHIGRSKIAEVIAEDIIIKTAADGLEILADLYYQGFYKMMLHAKNISEDFFDLKSGMAGELLQKFSNYRVRLAIIGDFNGNRPQSFKDFMYESNKKGQVVFVGSVAEAIHSLA